MREALTIMLRMLSIIKPDITLICISRVWPIIKAGITWEAATNDVALLLVFRRVQPGAILTWD